MSNIEILLPAILCATPNLCVSVLKNTTEPQSCKVIWFLLTQRH